MEQSRFDVQRILIIIFSLAGMLIMSYLLYAHYAPTPEGGSFCDIGEGLSCDVVNKSAYSEVFGFPMAGAGVVYFALVLALALWRYSQATLMFTAFLLIVLLGPSLYLSIMSKTVLNNMCILCETSKALMAAIAGIALYAAGFKNFGWNRTIVAVALAIALAFVTYFIHSWIVTDPFSYSGNIGFIELFTNY